MTDLNAKLLDAQTNLNVKLMVEYSFVKSIMTNTKTGLNTIGDSNGTYFRYEKLHKK